MTPVFLHGLASSSRGTKGKWFRDHFPAMLIPGFSGTLVERMTAVREILKEEKDLLLVGSSFGGLMVTLYAMEYPDRVKKVVLLAPALNFPEFSGRNTCRISVPAFLYIGQRDETCPPDIVIPRAREIFSDLSVQVSDDDHLLHATFRKIDWSSILMETDGEKQPEE